MGAVLSIVSSHLGCYDVRHGVWANGVCVQVFLCPSFTNCVYVIYFCRSHELTFVRDMQNILLIM